MSDAKQLRELVAKLFAFAIRAREQGKLAYADDLTEIANEALTQAEDVERQVQATGGEGAAARHQLQPWTDDPAKG